jgi:CubicO group peptidase (beta-lactamase class C family)
MATVTTLAPETSPEEAGFDPERLSKLDRYLDGIVESGELKGSLIVIGRGGKIVHVSMRGHRDEAAGLPVEADTIWRIYSMTKPITSVAALILFEEGSLSLLDPVSKFIPSFENPRVFRKGSALAYVSAPASQPLLVWHLLTHTSGLTYEFMFNHPVDELYRNAGFMLGAPEDYTLEEACERFAAMPLLFEPGTGWNYSRSTDVLGRVIEVASGMPLDEFFRQRIFEPLGMRETGFALREEDRGRLAALTMFDPQTGQAVPAPDVDLATTQRPKYFAGGHGLVSTAGDYHRFVQMLLRRGELDGVRVLSPRTVDLMTENHLPGGATITSDFGRPLALLESNEGRGFGLGVAPLVDPVGAKSLSSYGEYHWHGAANTHFWVDPAEELTVVFCAQALFAPDTKFVAMRQLVYGALVE